MRMKAVVKLCIVITAGILTLLSGDSAFAQAQNSGSQAAIEKTFPHSNKCKRCHERVYEEWETSPLAKSIHSPAFRAALDAYVKSHGGKDQALCFRCHAPHVR